MKAMRKRPMPTILLTFLLAVPSLGSAVETPKPALQGTWRLNEDITARMMEGLRSQGGPGGGREGFRGRPPGGGGRGGGRPGGMGGGSGPEGRRGEGGPRPSLDAFDVLTIAQTDTEVTITDKNGHARVLKTDGSKVRDEAAPGGPAELRTKWGKDGSLVVKVKPQEGPARTETYVVSNDGKHLYLTVEMEGGGRRPAFKIRRAYDPAPAEGTR